MKSYYIKGGSGNFLYVEEFGNRDGLPLFFIHGFSQSRLRWINQTNSSLANGFRIITMDLRGHGNSEKPKDGYGDASN